ncbi:MAG: amino acid adenylation domain-containing protein [Rhodobacteraceae bacterium]|nr:amino acid adenylation domain-containing protein [Paracoccaceae bacterium]
MTGLQQLLLSAVARQPDAIAVVDEMRSVTYSDLDAGAAALATRLAGLSVCKGDRIGVWLEKSAEAIVAMQAALRLGAIYAPLDPNNPPRRVEALLQDCEASALVTTADRAQRISAFAPDRILAIDAPGPELSVSPEHPPCAVGPEDLAYILYTSGSTGAPKGVCVSHRAALAFIEWAAVELGATAEDRFASHAPFHFDLSVLDIYVAMRAGARLYLIPDALAYAPKRLTEFIERNQLTIWYSVPTALVLMLEHGELEAHAAELPLRVICFAGEVFPLTPLRRLRAAFPAARLLNFYGPTETNVCAFHEVTDIPPNRIAPVPIGKASSGDRIWAETETGVAHQAGEVGELVVEGPSIMSGYWGRAAQVGPYRTGDLVRLEEGGDYVFLGRSDHMVKVRGFRIELGEIEAVLAAQLSEEIAELAVVAVGEGASARLRACVVPRGDVTPSLLSCKQACATMLPRYMIIDEVMRYDRLPRTANGKIDRMRLAVTPFAQN